MTYRPETTQDITATAAGASIAVVKEIENTGGAGDLRILVYNLADPTDPLSEDVYLCSGTDVGVNPRIIEPGASKSFDELQWGLTWKLYAASNTDCSVLVETRGNP